MNKIMMTLVAVVFILSVNAQQNEVYAKEGIAISGYDPVAYFTQSKAVKGDGAFVVDWKNVKWLFANSENAELFKTMPEKYEPQYGGYCAFGCSRGYKAKTNPDVWTIDNGKLYLNYDTGVRDIWNKDRQVYILKANANWPKVRGTRYP
jgi:hypothetical protein